MRTRNVLKGQVEVQAVPEKVLRTRGSKNKPVELSTVKKIQSSTVPAKIRLGRSTKTADKENHSNASPTEAVTAVTKTRVGRRNKLEDITEPEEHLPKKRQNDSNPKTSYSKITAVTRKETSSPVREQIKAATEKTSADDSLAPAKRRGRPRKTAPDSVVQTTNVPQLTLEAINNPRKSVPPLLSSTLKAIDKGLPWDSNTKSTSNKISAETGKETSSPVKEGIKAAAEKTSADDSTVSAKRRGRPRKNLSDSAVQTTKVSQSTPEGITNSPRHSNTKSTSTKITAETRKETSSPIKEGIKDAAEKSSAVDSPAPGKRRGRPRKKVPEPEEPKKEAVQTTKVPQHTLEAINIPLQESPRKSVPPLLSSTLKAIEQGSPRGSNPKTSSTKITAEIRKETASPVKEGIKAVGEIKSAVDSPAPGKRRGRPRKKVPEPEEPKNETVQTTKVSQHTPEAINIPLQESPRKSLPQPPTSPLTAIEQSSPAISIQKPVTNQVPLQRSPVYLTNVQKDKPSIAIYKSNKRAIVDDEFGLMPLKPSAKKQKKDSKPAARTEPVDDIYGFEFNESQESPKSKKKVAKPKQQRQKKTEAPKFWDDKNFQQRQKQIKINVINKDFKPQEKPIPPPPSVNKIKPVNPLPSNPNSNSTMKSSNPRSEINIIDIPTAPLMQSHVPDLTISRSMPWRYSSIKPMTSVTMSSLNDSNGENVNPVSAKNTPKTGPHRPLHTLQLQRSPMKELNPNETILVPRPRASPLKKVFGVENNFGFESDEEECDGENLEVKKRKMDEKVDSLKRFRHSLNLANSSSPLGPVRLPRPVAVPKAAPSRPLIRNIFTSTPQQMKIQDAFKASTPLPVPGPSKEKDTVPPNLFESLTFEEAPKRNYSLIAPRRKKRVDFLGYSDDDVSENETNDEEEAFSPRRKQQRKIRVNKVQEEKLAKFVDEFNSMCDEVEQYELVIE